ncbi:MAG: hypothetical protein KAU99_04055, partial [Thermoplasmata archaeon]|nr:hypothetical protein [Thermoplasmata archaeon]
RDTEDMQIVLEKSEVDVARIIGKHRHNQRTANVIVWACLALFIGTVPALLLLSSSIGALPSLVSATALVIAILTSEGLGQHFKEKAERLSHLQRNGPALP